MGFGAATKKVFKAISRNIRDNDFTKRLLSTKMGKGAMNVHSFTSTKVSGWKSAINARKVEQLQIRGPVSTASKLRQGAGMVAHTIFSSRTSLIGQAALGSAAMISVSMMSGGIGKAQDIMIERYMKDSRYSSRLSSQTSVGQARGNSKLSLGNINGLSQSLHSGRHG